MGRLQRHAATSVHVAQLLREPFLEEMLAEPAERRLLATRGSMKEVSEAYAALNEVRRVLKLSTAHTGDANGDAMAERGEGVLLLDVCSGKGVGATLLSRLLPAARIVMLDVNDGMELTHVACRPNVRFLHLDLHSREAVATLRDLAEGGDGAGAGARSRKPVCCVAMGMHACGSLSPRLLAIASNLEGIDACVLCPCCIKGGLGDYVKRTARAQARPNYDVLLEVLAAFAERESNGRLDVSLRRDEEMTSPRNGFVTLVKTRVKTLSPGSG